MRSVDTNVLVRALTRDDPAQTPVAVAILAEGALILPTVVQETVWVLGRSYGWTRELIAAALRGLATTPCLTFESRAAFDWALDRFADGADFADMLHLALSGGASSFATFDQRIARHADASVVHVETLAT